MARTVRRATIDDIPQVVELLLKDAAVRHSKDAVLWRIADDASEQIEKALLLALAAEQQPFRQFWQVAVNVGNVTGVIHSMMLPVPPIYAGAFGEPGLILSDSFATPGAADGTVDDLVAAAEEALREAGAQIILSSFVTGQDWQDVFQRRGYEPLTLYLYRTGFGAERIPSGVRLATEADVPGIVQRSAENRRTQSDIDPFWESHPEANARFSAWMTRSLALGDRDMLVMGPPEDLKGYVIAQPASRLHFPPAHDITGTGVIDDYYHTDLASSVTLSNGGEGAMALLRAAKSAFSNRGMGAAFVVCPAGWRSKIDMLQTAGYRTAVVWSIKR